MAEIPNNHQLTRSFHKQWVKVTNGDIPAEAIREDFNSKNEIYVARAYKHGKVLIGRVVRGHSFCSVSWERKEVRCNDYEVLCHSKGGQWIPSSFLFHNATVEGGIDNGELIYVGRAKHHSSYIIGGVYRSQGVCKYLYQNKEYQAHSYEVLELN